MPRATATSADPASMEVDVPSARERTSASVEELAVPVDDAELVRRIQAGDAWAEEALYRRHARLLGNLAARLLGDTDEAMDVVQDAFIDGLEAIQRLREPSKVEAWLRQIAVRQVHRRLRRRRLRRRLGLVSGEADRLPAAGHGANGETVAELWHVHQALERASAEARVCWSLRHVEGYTVAEVAETCGLSTSTVKRRLGVAQKHVDAFLRGTARARRLR